MTFTQSFLSFWFIATAVAGVFALRGLRGAARQAAFLAINVFFTARLVLGVNGFLTTLGFCLIGFVALQGVRRRPSPGFGVALGGLVVLFVYMRNYAFLEWMLPTDLRTPALATVGLSFLFFKIVHILIESRSQTLGEVPFITYLNYCFNFTAFTMGPIQRFPHYRDQWTGEVREAPETVEGNLDAVLRILGGLVKAYVLGALIQPYALSPSTEVAGMTSGQLWLSVYAFYFFLYLNFAGYCDVVIGVGNLMGVVPPENFNKPFLARDVSDFWNRQHRSLTKWLTDYVFSPLYKTLLSTRAWSARPVAAVSFALMVTMLVSGLWHGTTAAFFLFGAAHGVFLVIYRVWDAVLTRSLGRRRVRSFRKHVLVHVGGIAITFHATALAFVFFNLNAADSFIALGRLFGVG